MQLCSDALVSADEHVVRDLTESAFRLLHCLSPEFVRTFNLSSFVSALESGDSIVKW